MADDIDCLAGVNKADAKKKRKKTRKFRKTRKARKLAAK